MEGETETARGGDENVKASESVPICWGKPKIARDATDTTTEARAEPKEPEWADFAMREESEVQLVVWGDVARPIRDCGDRVAPDTSPEAERTVTDIAPVL